MQPDLNPIGRFPAPDPRDSRIMDLIRGIDAIDMHPCFNLDFRKYKAHERAVTLATILEVQSVFDIAESVGLMQPIEGIRIRTKGSLEEQQKMAAELRKVVSETAPQKLNRSIPFVEHDLPIILMSYRLGLISRINATTLLRAPEQASRARCRELENALSSFTNGRTSSDRYDLIAVQTTCCLDDSFGSEIAHLDPAPFYERRTSFRQEIKASYTELRRRLGVEPYQTDQGGKSSTQWLFQLHGHVFTVYDYKLWTRSGEGELNKSEIRSNRILPWHIGSHRGVDVTPLLYLLGVEQASTGEGNGSHGSKG